MPELVKELTRHMIACVALGVVPAVHFLLAASEKEMGHAKQVGLFNCRAVDEQGGFGRRLRLMMAAQQAESTKFSTIFKDFHLFSLYRRLMRAWKARSGS